MDPLKFLGDIEDVPRSLREFAGVVRTGEVWHDARESIDGDDLLLVGMGSSYYAAHTVAAWLRSVGLGVVAELASQDPSGTADGVILVSAGGTSVETLERHSRLSASTQSVALTNVPGSALADVCSETVLMHAGPELGGVACRTYRHTLAALMALGPWDVAAACERAADATQSLLEDRAWLDLLDDALRNGPATFWIAPSGRIGTAWQSALMMRECPRTVAVGCETGDWSHVDVYLTKTLDYRAVVFTGSRWDAPAAEWMTQRASTVVSIGATSLGVPGEQHIDLDLDPLAAMLTEPLFAELLAQRWWANQ